MTQYIDKSALVAEIKGYISNYKEIVARISRNDSTWVDSVSMIESKIGVLQHLLAFLNTLEVKEVQEESVSNDLEEVAQKAYPKDIHKQSIFIHGATYAYTHFKNTQLLDEGLEEAATKYAQDKYLPVQTAQSFKAGAKWQKNNFWKPADGDDLPEIDREVIALIDNGKAVFAHRPPEYWDGKNILTGEVTRHEPKRYDKGGWNMPNIKYWLDVDLPKNNPYKE